MSVKRDLFSHLGFFRALYPGTQAAAAAGETIDLRDFDAATIAFDCYTLTSALSATLGYYGVLQHGLASAAGVSAWSNVPASLFLHSVYGAMDSTSETGRFKVMESQTDSGITFIGYKGDHKHRYLRVYLSLSGTPVSNGCQVGAVAILGDAHLWPVNTAIQ
jgi:hypothetical protein